MTSDSTDNLRAELEADQLQAVRASSVPDLPDMQAGMHSRGFERAVLNQDEVRLQHFHDWLDHWMAQA